MAGGLDAEDWKEVWAKDNEPEFDNWKDAWESNAKQVQDAFLNLSEAELLEMIKNDQIDMFYQIWGAITQKGTKEKALPILLAYLERNLENYSDLNRYHCLEAIFKICNIKDKLVQNEFLDQIPQMARDDKKIHEIKKGITALKLYIDNFSKIR